MATLNLSQNGPSIKRSYQSVVDAPAPSGAAAASSTYGQWAVFSVQAPLVSAFQQDSSKESVLKVQSTGEGELIDLIDDFSEGRIQFAFVKVKDPNTSLPKNVLIAWCGEGVPERTKGYFGSHLGAVSKLLHGYHVQITARSDRDLTPEGIVQKVADSSGAKYGGGAATTPSAASGGPPPPASKPVFMPTRTGGGGAAGGFNPLGARARAAPQQSTDNDGWGEDAPQVTRSQLEKVAPAYKPTKVNMAELTSQKQEPSRFQAPSSSSTDRPEVVRGAYQPIGKVDIAAIRAQAKDARDDRPTAVKGAYEPIGKVDIAAIRAKAQAAPPSAPAPLRDTPTGASQDDQDAPPRSLADRSAAFTQSERLTSLPKPKVANRFGSSTSTFTGTKAPTPGAFESKPLASAAPVGVAGKNFADEGGKTPAQIWAEKKARQRGMSGAADTASPSSFNTPASPVQSQPSGGWQSGYSGKKWGDVATNRTGASNVSAQRTGQDEVQKQDDDEPHPPAGGVGAIRDRFKNTAPIGAANISNNDDDDFETRSAPAPPPMDFSSKPNAGPRGVPMPGLPQRREEPQASEDYPEEEHVDIPPPPAIPRSPTPPSPAPQSSESPVRIAMPVSRSAAPEPMEAPEEPAHAMPVSSLSKAVSNTVRDDPEPAVANDDDARNAGHAAVASTFGAAAAATAVASSGPGAGVSGKRALIQYDYEKAEDNEIELREGDYVTNIEMVDDDWWMGQNSAGESGLFPSNYVELVEDEGASAGAGGIAAASHEEEEEEERAPPAAPPVASAGAGKTATAQYDYEAAEENELSFPDGATITNVEFPDDDWWFGEFNGKSGLFPANYVQIDE
ncbi:hypothetical protein MBLNU459_g3030t1 [Dothideomycetes sp. NU459]